VPIYEYQCDACGHKLEKLQKISDNPLRDCPECDESTLRKLVSAVAFRLKGGGWYETDFKEEKTQKNLAKDEDKPKEPGDKTSDKPDKKETGKDNKDSKEGGSGADNTSSYQAGKRKPEPGKSTPAAKSPAASSPTDPTP